MKSRQKKKPKSQKDNPPLTYRTSEQFWEDYSNLSESQEKDADRLLQKIVEHGKFTPGMKPKKLPGHRDIWYLRASRGTRITYEKLPDNVIYLRRVGDHKILKTP